MKVAITTTEDRYAHVARTFRDFGFTPLPAPCITTIPHQETALRIRDSPTDGTVIVIASTRALDICWPTETPANVDWLAVGEASAEAIRARGGTPVVTGAAGLTELLELSNLAGRHVLFPHAAGTDPSVFERFRDATSFVHGSVYTTGPVEPPMHPVDAVVFGSPSAVTGWHLRRSCEGLLVGAIGRTTEQALSDHGVTSDAVPSKPSYAALALALRNAQPAQGSR
jgi:uroporphyrinogen-III synthase